MTKLAIIPLIMGTMLLSIPAFGQTAYEDCKKSDTQNQVLGAVVGGSLGAVLGNEVSGDEGAVIGGLAGGTAGVAIADKDCEQYKTRPYVQPHTTSLQTREVVTYDSYGNRVITTTKTQQNPGANRGRKLGHKKNKQKNTYYPRG